MSDKPSPACRTARLLTRMAAHQSAGNPVHWRATGERVWLSTGDPTPALQDAAAKFPGALAQNTRKD